MARSIRSYQREIAKLKDIIDAVQWVKPSSNSSQSCSGCGNPRHWGCATGCEVAAVTKDSGEPEGPTKEVPNR